MGERNVILMHKRAYKSIKIVDINGAVIPKSIQIEKISISLPFRRRLRPASVAGDGGHRTSSLDLQVLVFCDLGDDNLLQFSTDVYGK